MMPVKVYKYKNEIKVKHNTLYMNSLQTECKRPY